MNIFFLSRNAKKCAQWHCDKHVVKMICEYAQLLSTAHHTLDTIEPEDDRNILYKKTHQNHPCAVWTRESNKNYEWLYELFCNLCDEYILRYNKIHKTDKNLRAILRNTPVEIPDDEFTEPPQAMPDEYKVENDVVLSYRIFYVFSKSRFAQWSKVPLPWWFCNKEFGAFKGV